MAVPVNLYGKSVLVGRDPLGQGRLRVRVEGKAVDIAVQPQVPSSVSRLKDSGEAHCSLDVSEDGGVRVTNLKEKNITRVGGVQVVSKAVGEDDMLTLGSEGFTVGVGEILKAAGKLVGETYSIGHLKKIYEEYEQAIEAIQRRQQKRQRQRMLPIMFGSLNTILAAVLPTVGLTKSLFVTLPLAVASFALYFVIFSAKDSSIEDRKAATDRFTAGYVCPKCGRFMGYTPYSLLQQNNPGSEMICPGSGCRARLRFDECNKRKD